MPPADNVPWSLVLIGIGLVGLVLMGILGAMVDLGTSLDAGWKAQQKAKSAAKPDLKPISGTGKKSSSPSSKFPQLEVPLQQSNPRPRPRRPNGNSKSTP